MATDSRPNNPALSTLTRYIQPSTAFLVIIFAALIAFEFFNYSTTERALNDMLGPLTFWGMPWATVLAIAFCGIDFAGIARLFTPEQSMSNEPKEVWYLFGAWLLAATMNAILTWWGVSIAVNERAAQPSDVIDAGTLINVVPIFVAIMVWVIRILIIGTLSVALDRMLHSDEAYESDIRRPVPSIRPTPQMSTPVQPRAAYNRAAAAQQRYTASSQQDPLYEDEEPKQTPPTQRHGYHTVSMNGRIDPNSGTRK